MPTAKELIEAAKELKDMDPYCPEVFEELADHVLATVREDDDEPANWAWIGSTWGLPMTFEVDDGLTTYCIHTKPRATQFTVSCDATRGQVRHLFTALGITLKSGA